MMSRLIATVFGSLCCLSLMAGCAVEVGAGQPEIVLDEAEPDDLVDVAYERDPCRPFFVDRWVQMQYSHPFTADVCAIDVAALSEAEVRYRTASETAFLGGNVVLLLESHAGTEAIVTSYRAAALDAGLSLEPPRRAGVQYAAATAVAVGVVKCAKSKTCRKIVKKGGKWLANTAVGGAVWDAVKSIF